MSANRLRFLVVFDEGLWTVCEVGSRQSLASFLTCEEAVQNARHLAERTGAELLVMNADGTVASRESCALRETA